MGFRFWITTWNINAYKFAFSKYGNVGIAYAISVGRTIVGTIAGVFVTLLAAYPLSKRDIPGRNFMTVYNLITMFEEVTLPTQSVRAAITIITIGPIIFFYPFLQKYFVKRIFLGSLKG